MHNCEVDGARHHVCFGARVVYFLFLCRRMYSTAFLAGCIDTDAETCMDMLSSLALVLIDFLGVSARLWPCGRFKKRVFSVSRILTSDIASQYVG